MCKNSYFDKHRFLTVLFTVLSVAVLCFIYSQSILSGEESGDLSRRIVALIKPILDPGNVIAEEVFHHFVRKLAHFSEFAALGCCVNAAFISYSSITVRKFISLPLLLTLLAAVGDEFLQYFTGRGSMVTDVVIDYAGALFGIGVAALISHITLRKKS